MDDWLLKTEGACTGAAMLHPYLASLEGHFSQGFVG